MLSEKQLQETEEIKAKAQISYAQPDDLIDFYHLKSRKVKNSCIDCEVLLNIFCCFSCHLFAVLINSLWIFYDLSSQVLFGFWFGS